MRSQFMGEPLKLGDLWVAIKIQTSASRVQFSSPVMKIEGFNKSCQVKY
jgi:hypothetical protein